MFGPALPRRSAEFFLYAAILLSACIWLPRCLDAFWAPETLAARLLAPLPILLLLLFASSGSLGRAQGILKAQGLWWPGLLLMGLMLFSSLLCFRPELALRESANRSLAILIFWASLLLGEEKAFRSRLVELILALASLQAALALIQISLWNFSPEIVNALDPQSPFSLILRMSFRHRAFALLGNPDFLGAFLCFALPLSLSSCNPSSWTLWSLGRSALIAAGLAASHSRSAILASLLGCVLLWLLRPREKEARLPRPMLWGLILLLLSAFLLLLFLHGQAQGFDAEGLKASALERIALWRVALQLIWEHPFFGIGAGHFGLLLPSVEAEALKGWGLPFFVSSHAHSDLLQFAAEYGLPSLLLLVFLHLAFYSSLWISLPKLQSEDRSHLIGMLIALFCLEVDALANFPFQIQVCALGAGALAGCALGLSNSSGEGKAPRSELPRATAWRWASILILLYLFSVTDAWKALTKSTLAWAAEAELAQSQSATALEISEKGINIDSQDAAFWRLEARSYEAQKLSEPALAAWQKALSLEPWEPQALLAQGQSLFELGRFTDAETKLKEATQKIPNDGELWKTLGNAQFMEGNYVQAEASDRQALTFLAPSPALYENLGAAQGEEGHFDDALASLAEAEVLDPRDTKIYLDQGITYIKMGKSKDAKACIEKGLTLEPNNAQLLHLKAKL